MHNPHSQPIKEILAALDVDADRGLSESEVERRLGEYGRNVLPEEKKEHLIITFLKQFHGTLQYILFVAAGLSLWVGEKKDAIGIIIAVMINVVFSFVQERRAESAIDKLKSLIVQEVTVIRGGEVHRMGMDGLVPGDVILLSEGDRVSADARLLELKDLQTDESSLTGESVTQRKSLEMVPNDTPVGDRNDMVWMGTTVAAGTAKAVVVTTGSSTEFGKIAVSLRDITREKTPFERRVDGLGRRLGIYAVVLSALVLIGGTMRGFPIGEMFFFSVAMMVSVIPEGLPAVMAVVLAIGVQRMARRNAIIRHVPSVETLGVADIICTDKTGTLTENKMTIREIVLAAHDVHVTGEGWSQEGDFLVDDRHVRPAEMKGFSLLLKAAAVTNRATVRFREGSPEIIGDPTEGALVIAAAKAGFDKMDLEKEYTEIDAVPFTSERKYQASLRNHADLKDRHERYVFVVGAYDVLKDRIGGVMDEGTDVSFSSDLRERFDTANERMAEQTLRVLCIAYKKVTLSTSSISDTDVEGLTLLGLVGMMDPPRKSVSEAIARARKAGVRVIMITGDQKTTAMAIGREIGLLEGGVVATGTYTERDIAKMDDAAFLDSVRQGVIFARVSPQTKLRIVTALQDEGHTVAMTGDGVNDAPALKKASIGIAMGIAGTDVSREVADMVLADDNFVSIVNAIEEGRTVFTNVKNTTAYLFMTNVGEVFTILIGLLFGLPLPLLPAQILWMNLVTDGFPDMALATESTDSHELDRAPRSNDTKILSRGVMALTIITAPVMCIGTLGLFVLALRTGDIPYARTVAFTTMAIFQLWNVFNMRSLRQSIFTLGIFTNMFVFFAAVLSVGLQLVVVYVPVMQDVFRTVPLGLMDWVRIILVTSSIVVVIEVYKFFERHSRRFEAWQ